MAFKTKKRKSTPLLKSAKVEEIKNDNSFIEESDDDVENTIVVDEINNKDDSSDSEREEFHSDDESVLSFDMSDESGDEDDVGTSDDDEDDESDVNEDNLQDSDSENDEDSENDSGDEAESDEEIKTNEEPTHSKQSAAEVKIIGKSTKNIQNDSSVPKKSKSLENFKNELNKDSGVEKKSTEYDEYEHDTSDEEDIRNTVGNIPMHWYDEYKHIGYDWDAKKIIKPPKGDALDNFLKKMEDPDFWRTVTDPQTGQSIVLTDDDIDLIKRINKHRIPDKDFDSYEPWIDWFSSEIMKMPIVDVPAHKRSFIPSKLEKKKIGRIVHSLKMGWMKTREELAQFKKQNRGPKFYMIWETDTDKEKMRRIHDHVTAPKRDLPGHAESYNPPLEYLFNEREMKEWEKLKDEPHKRKLHFLPQRYKSLRQVPAYPRFLKERFLRCLDLYLCPRAKRMKLTIEPEHLIPKLPSPKDLQPFPTTESLIYRGHTDLIRCISIEPKGEYIVTGSDDMTIKIWEIQTARCIKTIQTEDVVRSVAWCPNSKLLLILVASGKRLLLINPKVGDKMLIQKTDEILEEEPKNEILDNERIATAVKWSLPEKHEYETGIRLIINHFKDVKQTVWHNRGDYFATVMPEGANRSVIIHQLSKRKSQIPFSKSKGFIQCVLFHPIKPSFFVATQRNIRIYDLVKQELMKKLLTNSKWISGMSIHSKGDNLLVSTYDKKILWFDLDLSTKPYQTLRLHSNAVRNVAYHLRYPLFASSSDDQSVIVSHGMVYNDLLQNPLIVPLKKLRTHEPRNEFGVFDVIWHPTQPWVFSTGADATVRLYT